MKNTIRSTKHGTIHTTTITAQASPIRHLSPRRPTNQEANTTLPVSGEDGSLTVNNDIVIDTTAPYVIAVLSLREGVYTMGQTVDLQVGTPVVPAAQRVGSRFGGATTALAWLYLTESTRNFSTETHKDPGPQRFRSQTK